MSDIKKFQITKQFSKKRLDKILTEMLTTYSRTYIGNLIKNNFVKINNKIIIEPDYKPDTGDMVEIELPPQRYPIKDNIDLPVIYNDDFILVINKPPGINVHPVKTSDVLKNEITIVDIIYYKYPEFKNFPESSQRPGIVHRLDKDTSGVMVIAKNPQTQFELSKQFSERKIEKTYLGIVNGSLKEKQGTIDSYISKYKYKFNTYGINAKNAITKFKVLKNFGDFCLVEFRPVTGRTHQIRIHSSLIEHPILGDKLYNKNPLSPELKNICSRQMLHSYKLKLLHPKELKTIEFKAPLPEDFLNVLNFIKNNYQKNS